MIRTQIYIPEHLHQTVKALARKKNVPLAKVLRDFISIKAEEEKKKLQGKSLLSSLSKLDITGGPRDLSSNMDKYLYGR